MTFSLFKSKFKYELFTFQTLIQGLIENGIVWTDDLRNCIDRNKENNPLFDDKNKKDGEFEIIDTKEAYELSFIYWFPGLIKN